MNTNQDFNPINVSECLEKIELVLETYGSDVFFEAVTELLNSHPFTAPPTSSSKAWIVLLLPSYCNLDAIANMHDLTLTSASTIE